MSKAQGDGYKPCTIELMSSRSIIVIAHNIRSTHNIGSIFRTCEGFGISKLYLTGYSPYPKLKNDARLPHIAEKLAKQISKTALGAEKHLDFSHHANLEELLNSLKSEGYVISGLEQDERSTPLPDFKPPAKLALIIGEEVNGLTPSIRSHCQHLLEIPMFGQKESFNVSVATGIALYSLTLTT
jgi:tRNA G18 (ribose-2'-O)-methylase SpoU